MNIKNILIPGMLYLLCTSANASIIDFGLEAPTTGSMSYAGGGAALVGTGIDVDSIVGLDTPSNPNVAVSCDSCILEFVTGGNVGGWDFGGGGSISIVGGMSAAGIALGSTLLSGTFDSASVTDVGGGYFNFKITGGSFNDTKHPDLLTYFGMPSGPYMGSLNISFNTLGTATTGDAFTSNTLFSGDVVNEPSIVPIPASVWLFGSGLIGLVSIARRKV